MKAITPTDAIGWTSTAILLATISRQVFAQWKSKATDTIGSGRLRSAAE